MQFAKVIEQTPLTWRQRAKRLHIILAILAIGAIAVIGRLGFLQVANKDFLNRQGDARTIRSVTMPSYRGLITDRHGKPIAVSTPVDSIWVNPKHFAATTQQLSKLSKILEKPAHDITTKIKQHEHRSFVYIKRGLAPSEAQAIKRLNIAGLSVEREFRRYYPAGPVTAQLLGFTNIEDQGQAGIELAFENWLRPEQGKKLVLEDRMGHWVSDLDHTKVPKAGEDLALSIDLRIQTLAYNHLNKALKKLNAKSATLTMIDVQTGEILAMVSAPSFNPNDYHQRQGEHLRNRSLTDQIEPGSTIKTLSMVSLLEHSPHESHDTIDTAPGLYRIGKHTVRDVRNYGTLSLNQILVKSSNVGLSKLIIERPSSELLSTFRKFGLGEEPTHQFPGEMPGIVPDESNIPFVTATLSFGYALSTTPIQIARAYAIIANRGYKKPLSLLKIQDHDKVNAEQIITEKTADEIVKMLTEVMDSTGTGRRARIPGYKTAGKTGTTRLVGSNGYDKNRHNAMFVGFTPVNNPRLATVVLIEEPEESGIQIYGGVAAAPIYAEVVKGALHILNIPPDNA